MACAWHGSEVVLTWDAHPNLFILIISSMRFGSFLTYVEIGSFFAVEKLVSLGADPPSAKFAI